MALIGFIGFSVLLLVLGSAYVGWNLGREDGYQAAKAELANTEVVQPRISKSSSKPIYHFADNSRSVREAQRVIQKANQINQAESGNQSSSFLADTKSTSVKLALLKEKTPKCRWTSGRLEELKRIILMGGNGKESRFCVEFEKRRKEMMELNCLNKNSAFLGGVC